MPIYIVLVNLIVLLFCLVIILSVETDFWVGFITVVITLLIVNGMILISHALTKMLERTLIKRLNKIKEKKYSLYDWLGKNNLAIYTSLAKQKNINSKDLIANYDKTVKIIRDEYDTLDKLTKLKISLEVIHESPRIQLIKNSILTILLASFTPAVLQLVNFFLGEKELNDFIYYISLGISAVLWTLLLTFIDFISKESDRTSFLLKIVQKEIEKETINKSSTNY